MPSHVLPGISLVTEVVLEAKLVSTRARRMFVRFWTSGRLWEQGYHRFHVEHHVPQVVSIRFIAHTSCSLFFFLPVALLHQAVNIPSDSSVESLTSFFSACGVAEAVRIFRKSDPR